MIGIWADDEKIILIATILNFLAQKHTIPDYTSFEKSSVCVYWNEPHAPP